MSIIYLINPEGGAKVAISELEARQDEAHGWRRFDPTNPDAVFPDPVPLPAEEALQWANRIPLNKDGSARQKPGRKPARVSH